MRALSVVVFALALVASQATMVNYVAYLSGEQASLPAVTGFGFVYCLLDNVANMMTCNGTFNGLTGPVTAAHIHGPVPQGTDGAVEVPFNAALFLPTGASTGTWTQQFFAPFPGPGTFTTDIAAGNCYMNVHTAANPNGEIRGQLYVETDLFVSDLNAANQPAGTIVAPPYANATGRGWVALNAATGAVAGKIYYWNLLSVPTAAHIHDEFPGNSGGVIVSLSIDAGSTAAAGSITVSGNLAAQSLIYDMRQGKTYFNVHTSPNANGEIRGTLYMTASAQNNIPTGTYQTSCVSRGAGVYESSCFQVDGTGMVKISGGKFSAAGCAASAATSAWNKWFSWADMGINQLQSRPNLQMDKMPFRYMMSTFATTSTTDVTTNTGCAGCPGYNAALNTMSSVNRNTCPATCALLQNEYGNGYVATGATPAVSLTNKDPNMVNGFAYNDRTYYSYTQTAANPGCADFVASFPAATGPCTSAYTQTGYTVSGCGANTAMGGACTATCAAGYSGTVTGTVSCMGGTTYTGTFSGCSITQQYTIVNVGTTAWSFTGAGLTAASNPTLSVARGGVLAFTTTAGGSHPFSIKTASVAGTASRYGDGTSVLPSNGITSGTLTFTVPSSAPSILYYVCENHAANGMTGTIVVLNGAGMLTPTLSLLVLAVSVVTAALRV